MPFFARGGENHDRNRFGARVALHRAQDFQAVHFGKLRVQKYEPGWILKAAMGEFPAIEEKIRKVGTRCRKR
jgi:hypothetical protein